MEVDFMALFKANKNNTPNLTMMWLMIDTWSSPSLVYGQWSSFSFRKSGRQLMFCSWPQRPHVRKMQLSSESSSDIVKSCNLRSDNLIMVSLHQLVTLVTNQWDVCVQGQAAVKDNMSYMKHTVIVLMVGLISFS